MVCWEHVAVSVFQNNLFYSVIIGCFVLDSMPDDEDINMPSVHLVLVVCL